MDVSLHYCEVLHKLHAGVKQDAVVLGKCLLVFLDFLMYAK